VRPYPWLLLTAAAPVVAALALSALSANANVSRQAPGLESEDVGFALRARVDVAELSQTGQAAGGGRMLAPRIHRLKRSSSQAAAPNANAIDAGAAGTAPVLSDRLFDGLDVGDVHDRFGYDVTPADVQIGVGPNHIVEMVNTLGRIFDKSGSSLETFPLADLFAVPDGRAEGVPRLLYDDLSGRWFAAYMSYVDTPSSADTGELAVAVSETSDPSGTWSTYFTTFTDVFPDYLSLGVTDDKLTAAFDLYDIDAPPGAAAAGCSAETGFCSAQAFVLQKSDLLADADVVTHSELGPYPERARMRAARSLSSTNDQYMAMWSTSAVDELLVSRITGTPDGGDVTEAALTTLDTLSQQTPPPSRTSGAGECIVAGVNGPQQLGSPPCIDSGDGGMLDAVWRDSALWTSSTAACTPGGDSTERACAHLVEVSTSGTPSVAQDIMLGASASYLSWPAVTTDESNNLYVSLTRTSLTTFAEARATGRMASDPPNTMTGTVLLRAGQVVHTSGRWGSYLGAATDPSAPGCVWLAGEYAKSTGGPDWGTYVAALSYNASCGAPPPTLTPSATPTPPPGSTATPTPELVETPTTTLQPNVTSTNTPGAGATPTNTAPAAATPTRTPLPAEQTVGDANCDGRVNSLDALALLQFAASLLKELPCGRYADVNDDGVANALDAALVLQYDAGIIDSLPA